MHIALINASTKVTAATASLWARAVAWQAHHHISPAWSIDSPTIVAYTPDETIPAGAVRALMADTLDVADALGYHDVDPDGNPYIRVGTDGTPEVTFSHEVAELLGDADCNLFAQRPDGLLICREVGDPVQGSSYPVTVTTGHRKDEVLVSNFVHPAWFAAKPAAGARFDQLGHLSAPFTLERGGYQIWTDGKKYGNEFGSREGMAALLATADDKMHPAARTRRRYEALERFGTTAYRIGLIA